MTKYLFIFFLISTANCVFSDSNNIIALEAELACSEGKDKILLLNDLALDYSEISFKKALAFGNQALEMSVSNKYKCLEARTRLNLGNIYYEHCEYDKALNQFQKSLSLYREDNITNCVNINYALNNIAVVYEVIGEYTNALSCYLEALTIADEINDLDGKATAYVNIGSFYDSISMYDKALEYLTNALYIFKLKKCANGLATTLGNLSTTYKNLGEYDKALKYQFESLKLEEKIDNKSGMAMAYSSIADIYSETSNHTKSIEYYNKAIELAKSIDNKNILCGAFCGSGRTHFKLEQYERALKFYQQSLNIALEINSMEDIHLLYKRLSETYCLLGNHTKAIELFKKYDKTKDDLFNEALTKQMVRMESKYRNEKQKHENDLLKSRNQLQKLKLERFQSYMIFSVTTIIILIIVVTLLLHTIKKRKIAEHKLFESRKRYKTIFENSPLGIALFDENTTYISANNNFLEIIGSTREKMAGFNMLKSVVDKNILKTLSNALNGKKSVYEGTYLSVTGNKSTDIRCTFNCIEDKAAKVSGVICIVEDITERITVEKERRRLEEQLERARKMETIGLLAGGVAHDLNNVLSGIVSYPDLLLMNMPDDSAMKQPLLTIKEAGERAAAIVQDLLTLARRGVNATKVINLNNIVNEFLCSPECDSLKLNHSGIVIKSDLCHKPRNIIGSEIHLKKMLMNLVINAAEAGGNVIDITTRNLYIDKPIKGYDNIKKGYYVVLAISDDGAGISPKDIKNIFEPFYTKKIMGRSGTGLGMSVVWSTIQDHSGYINIQSVETQWTRIEIYFPVTEEKIKDEFDALPVEEYTGNKESVLVIDDIREQREIAKRILEKIGYSVNTVSSGEAAIEFVKSNAPDILILDMIMDGGIGGLETYKRILEIIPGQRAIIASGFSENNDVKETQELGAGIYIKKPYTIENIGIAVKMELNRDKSVKYKE